MFDRLSWEVRHRAGPPPRRSHQPHNRSHGPTCTWAVFVKRKQIKVYFRCTNHATLGLISYSSVQRVVLQTEPIRASSILAGVTRPQAKSAGNIQTVPQLPCGTWNTDGTNQTLPNQLHTVLRHCQCYYQSIWVFSRPGQSPGLLYKHLHHSLIYSLTDPFPPRALQRHRNLLPVLLACMSADSWYSGLVLIVGIRSKALTV